MEKFVDVTFPLREIEFTAGVSGIDDVVRLGEEGFQGLGQVRIALTDFPEGDGLRLQTPLGTEL